METHTLKNGIEMEYDLLRNVDGIYHAETVNWFLDRITPDDFFVEVGAHVGRICVDVVKNGKQKGSLVFEPNPATFQLLKRNMEKNGCTNFDLQEKAVLDKEGEVQMLCISDQPAMSSTVLALFPPQSSCTTVAATSLDIALKDIPGQIVLKTDAEGADALIWFGSKDVRSRIRLWYMEFMPKRIVEGLGLDPGAILDEMAKEYLFTAMDGRHVSKDELLEVSKTDICMIRR